MVRSLFYNKIKGFFSFLNCWSRFYNSMKNLKRDLCFQRNVNHFPNPTVGLVEGHKDCKKHTTSMVCLPKELFLCDSLVTFLLSQGRIQLFFSVCCTLSFFLREAFLSWYINASLFNFILSMLSIQFLNLTCVFMTGGHFQERMLQIFTYEGHFILCLSELP